MKRFPNKFRGEKTPGKNEWTLTRPFTYISKKFGKIVVPIGFVTDGASIPKFLWSIVGSPWSGGYADGAVIHDWIYHKNLFKRKECDQIFNEANKFLKVPAWKRFVIYQALRIFGGFAWKVTP